VRLVSKTKAPSQKPEKSFTFQKPAAKALRLHEGLLPDFKGLGMREVVNTGKSLGVGVVLEGTGLAVKQVPGPGAPLKKVRTVRVTFSPPSK
jgi:hypothetical protein